MRRRIGIIFLVVEIICALLLAKPFLGIQISDRKLLTQAVQEYASARPASEQYLFWDAFCQQAAQGYYDDAMATILLSNRDSDIQYALVTLAKIRARNGDASGALRAAEAYSNPDTRDKAIREIAVAQAQRGDVQGARQTASLLADSGPALQGIAVTQAEKGDLQGAHNTISSVPKPDEALEAIAEYQVKTGDFSGAVKTAERMSPGATGNLFFDIGFELKRRGEQSRIRELASEVTNHEAARAFSIDARLAITEQPKIVAVGTCDEADWDAVKGDFVAAYTLLKRGHCTDSSFVAIKQYSSDPTVAERTLLQSRDQMHVCFGLTEFAKQAGALGRMPDSLRLMDEAETACGENDGYLIGAVRELARTWTVTSGPKPVVKWARSRPTASQRAVALLGIAEALGHPHP